MQFIYGYRSYQRFRKKYCKSYEIQYFYKGLNRTYLTDFYLPEFKMIVELKDNHIWHKHQVKNGKWGHKENAAIEYCKMRNMKFQLLFPKDFDTFFQNIERDSLSFNETLKKLG